MVVDRLANDAMSLMVRKEWVSRFSEHLLALAVVDNELDKDIDF